jgi:hypothetical protein
MSNNLTSDGFNLKLFKEGSGSGQVPARVGVDMEYDLITIPHGYGSSELIIQAALVADGDNVILPFVAGAGGFGAAAFIDDTNLYIEVSDSSVVNQPAIDFDYTYRLLIP